MKAFAIAFFSAATLFLGSCADPLEQATVQEVPEKLQKGFTGQGQLGPIDRSDDRTIKETHP